MDKTKDNWLTRTLAGVQQNMPELTAMSEGELDATLAGFADYVVEQMAERGAPRESASAYATGLIALIFQMIALEKSKRIEIVATMH